MRIAAAVLLLLLSPLTVAAQVTFSEIMYDLEGSDSSREWVELYNSGNTVIDLNNWKFFENDTNHGLTVAQGDGVIASGGYAIIASDPDAFRADWPNYSGLLFDSSFSLNNTGEYLAIRNSEGIDSDSVAYSSDWGAAGDGNSLQLLSSWIAAAPTPGAANQNTAPQTISEDTNDGSDGTNSETYKESEETATYTSPEFITVDGGSDRVIVVGASEFFEASAYKKNGSMHPYATFRWNFGNGDVREGKKVLYQYNFPGKYVVMITGITADRLSATDRFVVEARAALLSISSVTSGYIELTNDSSKEINLSRWLLRSGKQIFQIPNDTIMLPATTLRFAADATGLNTSGTSDVALLYPNGQSAHAYQATYSPHVPVATVAVSATAAPATQDAAVASAVEKEMVTDASEYENFNNETLAAAGALEGLQQSGNLHLWLLALVVLLVVAGGGVLFVRAGEDREEITDASAYTIIDETPRT